MKTIPSLLVLVALVIVIGYGQGCSSDNPPSQTASPTPAIKTEGTTKWEGKLVKKPGNTPEEAKVYFVQNGKKRWVVSGDWIVKQGYKWPDDVQQIPASELDALPTGEPIQ